MKDLILRLMEIEERAQTISDEARGHLENLNAELAAAEAAKNREIEARADRRIEIMRSQAEEDLQKRLNEIEKRSRAEEKLLEEHFKKNRDRWSKSIYDGIIAL